MQIITLRKCSCSVGRRNEGRGHHCSRVDKCPLLMTAIHCFRRPCHYLPKQFSIFSKFRFPGRALWLWPIKCGFVIVPIFLCSLVAIIQVKWFRAVAKISFGSERAITSATCNEATTVYLFFFACKVTRGVCVCISIWMFLCCVNLCVNGFLFILRWRIR